jgi:hypothetical protein
LPVLSIGCVEHYPRPAVELKLAHRAHTFIAANSAVKS